jgi:predicted kinase
MHKYIINGVEVLLNEGEIKQTLSEAELMGWSVEYIGEVSVAPDEPSLLQTSRGGGNTVPDFPKDPVPGVNAGSNVVAQDNTESASEDGSSDFEDRASGRKPTNSWDSDSNEVKNYNYYKRNPREQRPTESIEDYKIRVKKTLPSFESLNDPSMTLYQKADAMRGYTITESGEQRSIASNYKVEDGKLTNDVDNEYGINDVQRANKILVDEDLDIAYENLYYNQSEDNTFVDNYFNSTDLTTLGVNPTDFQGWLNKNGFSEDFEQDMLEGVYSFEGNYKGGAFYTDSNKRDLNVNKERALNGMLNTYMHRQDERFNRKTVLEDILMGEEGVTFDDLSALEKELKYTTFDKNIHKNYTNTNFPELTKKNEENTLAKVAKAERRKNRQNNQNYMVEEFGSLGTAANWVWDAAESGGGLAINIPGGFWEGLSETAVFLEDMVGGNISAKRKRALAWEDQESEDGLNYFYVQGQGVDIDGQKYIKDADGGIYNVTSGYAANDVLSEKQFLKLNKKIDDEGVPMDDYNFIGGAKQMGAVTGNILFQVAGSEFTGAARGVVGARIAATANGFKSVSKYKKMKTLAEAIGGPAPKNIFQVIKPELVNSTMFQSFYGASIGYENTISSAKRAGLSDEEAEKLANSAMQDMSVLYAITGPINPRIPFTKAMNKWITKSGAIDDLIKGYTKTGSIKAANVGFKKRLLNFKDEAVSFGLTFGEEGFKEFFQENIQQSGEFEIVNAKTNKKAGFDLMKSRYTEQDFINTSILSFAAGGLLGSSANIKNGFKPNQYKRLQNLMYVGKDLAGSKARLDKMILEGKATAGQVDAILFDAEAAFAYREKMPPWIISRTPEAYIKAARVSKEIEKLKVDKKNYPGAFTLELDKQIENKEAELSSVVEEAAAKLVADEANTIEKILDSKGTKIENGISQNKKPARRVETFKTTDELLAADPSANPEADAYFNPETGQIIINLEVAAKTQAISAASHELLHKILKAEFSSNPEMLKIVEEFKAILAKTDSVYEGKSVLDLIESRLNSMYTKEQLEDSPDEWLTAFSDLVAKEEVIFSDFDDKTWVNFGKKIVSLLRGKGFTQISFTSGQDVFDFVRDYQENIQKGSVTQTSKERLGRGENTNSKEAGVDESEDGRKHSITREADKAKTALDNIPYSELQSGVSQSAIGRELPGMVKAQIGRFNLSKQARQDFIDVVVAKMFIEKDTTKWGTDPKGEEMEDKGTLYGFLNGRIGWRIKDVVREEYKRNPGERIYLAGIDTNQFETLDKAANVVDEAPVDKKEEAPKYKSLSESGVVSKDAIIDIKKKVLSTVRTLKSAINASVSINKTVTPLIAEIKKELGKQVDINLKEEMGGKKDAVLEKYLLKNKKAILENMTTTWLMTAMPKAVQKQVDGKFTSDWEGKKIDREKTTTNQAGRTSGADIVRRIPNVANALSDADFLAYIIGKDGNPIRGRKESLAKAMAEEISLEIFNTELQNEDSDISKAFENNQALKGVVLADNYIAEVAKQSERGNIKFSISGAFIQAAGKLVRKGLDIGFNEVVDAEGNILIDAEKYQGEEFKELGNIVRNAFDNELIPDGKELKFLQSIQASLIIPKSIKNLVKRAITDKSAMSIKKDLSKDMATYAKKLGKDITDVIGFDGFGYIHRQLDAAETKKDKAGKIIPGVSGEFYKDKLDIIKNQSKSLGLPANLNIKAVSLMNSSVGVMGKISRILNQDWAAEKKREEYKKLIPEIREANIQNKILAKHMITVLIGLVRSGEISPKSFISLLQVQTNATKGLRALSGLKYITFKDGPQGNMKGEHLADNGTSMFEIAELGFENNTDKELSFKIDGILEFHDQWLENRDLLDLVDKFGKANSNKDLRIRLLSEADQKDVYTWDLRLAEDLISEREAAIKSRNSIRKAVDFKGLDVVETAQKAIDNGRSVKMSLSPKKIRVFDFDDTLAITDSKVLYTMPNPNAGFSPESVKQKAIFMVGGPGAGKTNVGKGLQLGRQGYKVVNQDIALEAMKKESGLPGNESDYNEAQRSTRSVLGAAAKKAAVDKFDKYAKNGDGMVIDGTGASYNATMKKVKQLEDSGYEVHMVIANTPLETALARNKARTERSLPSFIVEKTWKQVDESSELYRKDFGDRLYEINTESIEYGKALPGDFLQTVYEGINKNIAGKIDAATFAKEAGTMESLGAEWNFAEFSKIVDGKEGPLLEVAKIIADKRGTKDVFVLTARPSDAAVPIKKFLASMGLDIPIKNITGLGDGSPKAKADWITGKFAEGYNDFYFADDHTGNVKAVKDVLNALDVKSKVQQARVKFSLSLDKEFNAMIERNKGVRAETTFSDIVAKKRGKDIGRFKLWMPSSLDDFKGLTSYVFSGSGRQGDADMEFFQKALIDPYFSGVGAIETAKQTIKNDFKALNKLFKPTVKKLGDIVPGTSYTYDQAIRVSLWTKAGYEIPGISKRDLASLNDIVSKDPELSTYSDGLLLISKNDKWGEPNDFWNVNTILSDLNNMTEKTGRKTYIAEFVENVDVIFSDKNLNKIEALYGTRQRDALEDIIYRMKSGTNRPSGTNKIVNVWNNWVNNSTGAIMFFNRKSAALQLISTVNFMNWSDNNPLKAAAAFANQPQYWKDWVTIFNSDKLKQRRSGLKSDVNEAEIANAAANSTNKAQATLSYLLKIGFTPTQIADSFAIASGGASFYRNRINTYKAEYIADGGKSKRKYTDKEAEEKAWKDFSQVSDETQQSGDPALISMEQASVLGRLVLTFQNTAIQLNRSIKKSSLDLYKRRRTKGLTQFQSDASNLSKVIYYGAIQNIIFTSLQTALFSLIPGFDDDDEEENAAAAEKKVLKGVNSVVDTMLKGGFGLKGAVVSTVKNMVIEYAKQEKKEYNTDHTYTILQAANLSPPIGSKLSKIYGAIQTKKFDQDVINDRGFSVTIDGKVNISPSYSVLGSVVSGTINLPLDRAITEVNSLAEAFDARNTAMQRIALGLGWRTWDVGTKNEENDLIKATYKIFRKEEGAAKAKATRAASKAEKDANLSPEERTYNKLEKLKKTQQIDSLEAYGLSKKEIRKLPLEKDRINKIISLKGKPKKESKLEATPKQFSSALSLEEPTSYNNTPKNQVIPEIDLRFKELEKLKKGEQVDSLKTYGLSDKQIKKLKYEEDRVKKIIQLQDKKRRDKKLSNSLK